MTARSTCARCFSALVCVLSFISCTGGASRSARPAGEGFGYVGGVTIGQRLDIQGATPKDGTWSLAEGFGPISADVLVTTGLGTPTCERLGATVCPSPEKARVRMRLSALLDFGTAVLIEGRPSVPFEVTRDVRTDRRRLRLQRLAAGRHCLLVTTVEEPRDAVLLGAPHHDGASLFVLQVGSSPHDHCVAAQPLKQAAAQGFPTPGGGGCGEPVISVRPEIMRLRRHVAPGTPLWLFASVCFRSAIAMLLRNGVPITHGTPLDPARLQQSATAQVRLGPFVLPPSGWNLLVVQDASRPTVQLSQPVLIEE